MSRYAIHHFADPKTVFREMSRVCKTGGLVVNVDMVSDENSTIRVSQNSVERMMDTTHTAMLSPSQLVQATTEAGLTMLNYLSRRVRVSFDEWQPHVSQQSEAYRSARHALEAELAGGKRTGMQPFIEGDELYFIHVWGVMIAQKNLWRPDCGVERHLPVRRKKSVTSPRARRPNRVRGPSGRSGRAGDCASRCG